jgi:N-methylhydantoinase A
LKLVGIDTGGTFTDFVLFDGEGLRVHKVLSTPAAPETAILRGLADLGLDPEGLLAIHGTTVATNAVLEGKGVRTVYVANRGLGDVLSIGRQARAELYELQPVAVAPPVPPELCLETGGRLGADGREVEPLTQADLSELAERLRALSPRAVAINLLFSYLDATAEKCIEAAVPSGVFVSRSSAVLPEIREYERGVATWLNAWVGPLVEGYLRRLTRALPGARVSVMQSSGETMVAERAGAQAVRMLLSGPAGGAVGAAFVGTAAHRHQLLSFDMGGTSTDVCLLDGAPRLTSEGRIGCYPVAVPMVDMHTIGAGGGSIAQVDAGGLLQVGPESAGAAPGPACYGLGGQDPTVTDANLVLGRLLPAAFLGGRMALDEGAARAVLRPLAAALGASVEQAALGVIRVANEHMARALRVISVQRGIDPRGFTLVCFGGAGALHVCALAEALGMARALVPVHAGVLSALGMLATAPGRQVSRTRLGLLEAATDEELERALSGLSAQGVDELVEEGLARDEVRAQRSLDLRYRGQSYTLNVPWRGIQGCLAEFAERHEQRYGHRMSVPVELVNLRVGLQGPPPPLGLQPLGERPPGRASGSVRAWGLAAAVPVYDRDSLAPGQRVPGPALLTETVATTWLAAGWQAEVDPYGNLLLDRPEGRLGESPG